MSVSLVARQHGVAPTRYSNGGSFTPKARYQRSGPAKRWWRRSEYRRLRHQVRELQRLLGKKTLENEILREALDLAQPEKRLLRSPSFARDDMP
jgi:transposase